MHWNLIISCKLCKKVIYTVTKLLGIWGYFVTNQVVECKINPWKESIILFCDKEHLFNSQIIFVFLILLQIIKT